MTASEVREVQNRVIVQLHSPYGPRGRGWFSGIGNPNNDIGKPGDFYIDLQTSRYFGPKTDTGWPPPFFTAGAYVTRYQHVQSTPSAEWIIHHGLGGKPSIVVVDTAGTVVIGEITYVSDLEIRVEFTSAFAGYAYLT